MLPRRTAGIFSTCAIRRMNSRWGRASAEPASACSRWAPTPRSARCTPRSRWRPNGAGAASPCTFRATGQTGIFVAGRGVSVDAVVADFISGATEWLTPANDPDHWDLVEGQGSLFHPSYAGVTLGLIHGAQPDAIVVCHEPTRTHMRGLPGWPLPELGACIEANLQAARLTNPEVVCAGICVNTEALGDAEAQEVLAELGKAHGLPCVDPIRTGAGPIANRVI